MTGVLGHYTNESTFEWNMPFFDVVVPVGEDLSLGLWIATSIVFACGLVFSAVKGKWGLVLLAILLPGIGTILSVVGGFRLAKPRSFWARHLYDRKTMAKSIARHEPPIDLSNYPEPKLRRGYERSAFDEVGT